MSWKITDLNGNLLPPVSGSYYASEALELMSIKPAENILHVASPRGKKGKENSKKMMASSIPSYLEDLLLYTPCRTMDGLWMEVSVQMAAATSC